jgi:Ca2+/H+ antiporter
MLVLNGILGISMLVGAFKFKEQVFQVKSVTIALVGLVSIWYLHWYCQISPQVLPVLHTALLSLLPLVFAV